MDSLPDLRQLKAFVAVADSGSFTLAARQLHLTQSAVSHSIRTLEDQLGCKLLERNCRSVKPTAAGEAFLRRTRRVIEDLTEACRELRAHRVEPMCRQTGGGLQRTAI
ncbi:MAG TPA: LysR family transcriptional regulator [Luteolibacter sp.]|nr:LysR family transcriptional regulator [Luteolibacter sp.]